MSNSLKYAFRNIFVHRSFSAINITGLVVSLTAFILMGLYIEDELSYDNFHKKGKDIVIDIDERDIPNLLKDLMQHQIIYDEISIEKPTLEDYFLQVVGKEQHEV